jgi:hypothetical protein
MDVVVVPLAGATTMSAGPKAPEGLHAAPVTKDEGAAAKREHEITTQAITTFTSLSRGNP